MALSDFEVIINRMGKYLHQISFSVFGEPLLHKDLPEFVKVAARRGIETSVYSNFQLSPDAIDRLVNSGLTEITISVDGTDQETYQKYRRGGSFDRVVQNIKRLIAQRHGNTPQVILQFLVMKHNQDQVEKFRQLAADLKVDRIAIKALYLGNRYSFAEAQEFLPEDRFSKYTIKNNKIEWKNRRREQNICYSAWHQMTVLSDGSVIPCCYDVHNNHVIGNIIHEHNDMKIWNGTVFKDWRRRMLRGKNGLCRNCPENIHDFNKDFFFAGDN